MAIGGVGSNFGASLLENRLKVLEDEAHRLSRVIDGEPSSDLLPIRVELRTVARDQSRIRGELQSIKHDLEVYSTNQREEIAANTAWKLHVEQLIDTRSRRDSSIHTLQFMAEAAIIALLLASLLFGG